MVLAFSSRRRGLSQGMVYGGIVAVYGYALIVSFFSLLAIPWQVTNTLLALLFGLSLIFRPVRRAMAEGFTSLSVAIRHAWAALALVVGVLVIQIGVTAIEAELSIDGQLYHGPALANIVQAGSLWGWSAPNQYLYYTNLSVAGGVNLATFAGDARFDNALQIPHLLLLILLINWALSRRFSSPFVRVSFAALIVSAPVIWLQPRILYVDLAYGAAVVACIFFVVFVREFRRFDILVVGVSIGAIFATKPAGILTGLFLLGVMIVVILARSRGRTPLRTPLSTMMVGFGAPLLMAMSFYLRNFVQFGNPVYPIQAKFGPLILPGILDLSIFASGERGNGLIDPSRVVSYLQNVGAGMLHGVTKLDYDPRAGGFGFVPLFVLVLAVALIAVQVFLHVRARGPRPQQRGIWMAQLGVVALSGTILLLQPATFDARYVIGPTVALLVAVLLTSFAAVPQGIQLIAGVIALVIVAGQLVWTERTMYPGIKAAVDVMQGPAEWQPNTPGNPRGQGLQLAWLPDDPGECVSVALQTSGGVTATGMRETTLLGTLPYGLYGETLCNRVFPITLHRGDQAMTEHDSAAIMGADFLVLYEDDVARWKKAFPDLAGCLLDAYSIDPTTDYPKPETVFRNTCA